MTKRLRYTGGGYGGSINGIPARDLTDEDIARLKLDADELIRGGLYINAVPDAPAWPQETPAEVGDEDAEAKADQPDYEDKASRPRRRGRKSGE